MSETQEHLLVVDDDREIRRLLDEYLTQSGYRVTGVGDGRSMRRALDEHRIDLVVLDLMLPGEDGLSLCRSLRAQSNIPVLMLTARGSEIDRIVGLEMGADDYLAKPFNPRELLARVKSILRRAKSLPHRQVAADRRAGDGDRGLCWPATRGRADPTGTFSPKRQPSQPADLHPSG